MPKWVVPALILLGSLALVPPLLIAKERSTTFREPKVHLIPDMDHQFKYKAQQENPLFADARAMRLPVENTVARGELNEDTHVHMGVVDGDWATTIPFPVTADFMARGKQRFDIFCSPCHGLDGKGNGTVAVRALANNESKWIPPVSFHSATVMERAHGHLYNTIKNGIRNMPGYASQIETKDRWAIVAYVRALQRSQNATIEDVPQSMRSSMR